MMASLTLTKAVLASMQAMPRKGAREGGAVAVNAGGIRGRVGAGACAPDPRPTRAALDSGWRPGPMRYSRAREPTPGRQPMPTIQDITLYRLKVPLFKAYNTKLGAITELDSIVAEAHDTEGRTGIGEATVIPGYTHESADGAWAFVKDHAERMIGKDTAWAKKSLDPHRKHDPHAASVLQVACEMIEDNPILKAPQKETPVPILAPVNSKDLAEIPGEIEELIGLGFRTLKIKVGWDVDTDLERVALIQERNRGRAQLRLDANQGFSREDGKRFAAALAKDSMQLFEQPCKADDWESNAAVAAVSSVPVMMDESIYGFEDIERAGKIKGCGFVKLKIGKMTSVDLLKRGLERIGELGMTAVLGNGAATDIGCWIEACVGRVAIKNAGEMHGYLKNRIQFLRDPLPFKDGAIVLKAGYQAALDHKQLERHATARERYSRISRAAE
ncbi:MAG: hypothetical protein EXQ96_06255 [Alphaproteobacteria bacterium]|nr:hypothetical protein [Alphaproteobacteria bacterium]